MEAEKKVIALAGNPNVGKSTVFNQLTGMRQHTGNWSGKTVVTAKGTYTYNEKEYELIDVPGAYSLMSFSPEEEAAREFICFAKPDAVIVVCDALCLERNMNLVLQILEVTSRVVICINLMDEAKKKHIIVNQDVIALRLGVPVVGTVARDRKGMKALMGAVESVCEQPASDKCHTLYSQDREDAIRFLSPCLQNIVKKRDREQSGKWIRWLAARILDGDESMQAAIQKNLRLTEEELNELDKIKNSTKVLWNKDEQEDICTKDSTAAVFIHKAAELCSQDIYIKNDTYMQKDRKWDRLFTGKWTAFPIMFLMLLGIFWLTIIGANYPSKALNKVFFEVENLLVMLCTKAGIPTLIWEVCLLGVYRTVAWVVSVMLPPMAIFFPLFTLLEDLGYLPRVAFNLDRCFQKCHACGKQALTM